MQKLRDKFLNLFEKIVSVVNFLEDHGLIRIAELILRIIIWFIKK